MTPAVSDRPSNVWTLTNIYNIATSTMTWGFQVRWAGTITYGATTVIDPPVPTGTCTFTSGNCRSRYVYVKMLGVSSCLLNWPLIISSSSLSIYLSYSSFTNAPMLPNIIKINEVKMYIEQIP